MLDLIIIFYLIVITIRESILHKKIDANTVLLLEVQECLLQLKNEIELIQDLNNDK